MKNTEMLRKLVKKMDQIQQPIDEHNDTKRPALLKGKVLAKILNVRAKSNKESTIVGKLKKNELIDILEIHENWYEIEFNNFSAFVFSKFVKPLIKTGIVLTEVINVRSLPNNKSDIIGKLKLNKKVIIVDQTGDWYKVAYKKSFGFVSTKYIGFEDTKTKSFLFNNPLLNQIPLKPDALLEIEGNRIEKTVLKTYNSYGNLLNVLSTKLGLDLACVIAVIGVESGGQAFKKDKMVVRFENHLFYRYWGKDNEKVYNDHFKFKKSKKWLGHKFRSNKDDKWNSFHGDQEKEHAVLAFARNLNEPLALISCSMGLVQILGSNSKLIGYDNVIEMYENFNKDIRYHIFALFDFFSPQMIKFLRNKQFVSFAELYNGPGQARRYGKWLQDYYEAFPNHLV